MTPVDDIVDSTTLRAARGELLLELLSEEIPSRMQSRAIEDLTGLIADKLAGALIPAAELRGYVTPRRLSVIAEGIPATQPDRSEERRGPRVGAPSQAIDGFLRSAGLSSTEECVIRDVGRGKFYFAVLRWPGQPAAGVLPELIRAAIVELGWPKSMRWPRSPLRWVRPLRSIICLFDGEIVPLPVDWLGCSVPVGRTTHGHRFLSRGEIVVYSGADYLEKLKHSRVIIDHRRRRETICRDLDRWSLDLGISVSQDPVLLDEVIGLAEFPVVLAGGIDPDFMSLPREVLATAMRTHQKYFSCVAPDGSAAPHFLFVANNQAEDGGKAIIAGNERVLRARLADARFFWDQDRKVRLEDRVEALKERVYHEKLGSVYNKAERMRELAAGIFSEIRYPDAASASGFRQQDHRAQDLARRAAWLAKADLSCSMVGEFPELQGIMGGYYARHDGEDPRVADAIAAHYKPLGPTDSCPTSPESIAVALADKVETLCGFFRIGEKPTGSRDPFALRRAALGVIRLILENGLRVELRPLIYRGDSVFQSEKYNGCDPGPELLLFIVDRLKVHLREQGVRHDLIAAIFTRVISLAPTGGAPGEDNLVRLLARVDALRGFLESEDGATLLVAYRRAANIVAIEEKRDGQPHDGSVDPALLRQLEEESLFERLNEVSTRAEGLLRDEQFEEVMAELARLRSPIDEFFDKVTVNTDVRELRENRLRLLSRIRTTMNRVADFSQIEG
jgi:glycyl-tRNA synthetase beta chain